MDEQTERVLFQSAAFLTMIANGTYPVPVHVKKESEELLDKIGVLIVKAQEQPGFTLSCGHVVEDVWCPTCGGHWGPK